MEGEGEGEVIVTENSHVGMHTAHPRCLALRLIAAVTALFDGAVLGPAAEQTSPDAMRMDASRLGLHARRG